MAYTAFDSSCKMDIVEACVLDLRRKTELQIEEIIELKKESIELHRKIQENQNDPAITLLHTDYQMNQVSLGLQDSLMETFDILFELLYRFQLELKACEKLGWHKYVCKSVPNKLQAWISSTNPETLPRVTKRIERLVKSLEHKFGRDRIAREHLLRQLEPIKIASQKAKENFKAERQAQIDALVKMPIPVSPEVETKKSTETNQEKQNFA